MPSTEPVEVFISYAEEDESLCEELEKHLKTLQREKAIASWNSRKIVAGMELKDEIDRRLNQSGIILLLISSDFLASDYHWTVEVTRALERNASGKARAIPVLLRSADWESPPIDQLSPLPRNRQPVKSWSDRDEAFVEVVKGIREELTRLTSSPSYSPPQQNATEKEILTIKPALEQTRSRSGSVGGDTPTSGSILGLDEEVLVVKERVTLEEAEKREDQATILINEADKLRVQGQLEDAVAKYREALQYNPGNVIAYNNLGFTLDKQGKFEEAVTAYRKAIQLDPNYANAYNNLGNTLDKQGKFEEAVTAYRKAIQLDPNFAIAYTNLGTALKDQGKLEEAIAACHQAIQLDPNYANAYNNLGSTLRKQGKLEEAVTAYRKAIQLDPNFAVAYYNLGITLRKQGKLEEAIAAYRQAIQLDPNFAVAYTNLGEALNKQGKLEEAVTAYRQAIQLDPNFAMAYNNLGSTLDEQGKFEEAVTAYRKAIQLDPNYAIAHANLEIVLKKQGKGKKFWGIF